MIDQIGKSLPIRAFYTTGKLGRTGLTVTVTVIAPDNTVLVLDAATVEIGWGLYGYTLDAVYVTTAGQYVALFYTADTTVNMQSMPTEWTVGTPWVQYIDAEISSRLASAGYSAPNNSGINSIISTLGTPQTTIAGDMAALDTAVADIPTAAAVATAVWASGTRTLSAFNFTVAATIADKTGYSLSTAGVQAVWDALLTALTAAGSIGKKLADWTIGSAQSGDAFARIGAAGAGLTSLGDTRLNNLDAAVSTRSIYAGADTAGTATLLTRMTANRAGYLDNLSAGAVAQAASIPQNFSALGISAGGKINEVALVDTTTTLTDAPSGGLDAAGIRAALATELARIDVSISTRNATAPDNTGIAANGALLLAVKNKTNLIPDSPAATGAAMTLTSAYDAAKTAATQASITALQATADAIHGHANIDPLTSLVPGSYPENSAGFVLGKFVTPDPSTPLSPIPEPPADMEMCRVTGYFETSDNKVPPVVNVVFELITAAAIKSDRIIQGRKITATITNGVLTSGTNPWVDLERNDLLTPNDSHWTVTCASVGFSGVELVLESSLFDLSSLIS